VTHSSPRATHFWRRPAIQRSVSSSCVTSPTGTKRRIAATQTLGRKRSEADISRAAERGHGSGYSPLCLRRARVFLAALGPVSLPGRPSFRATNGARLNPLSIAWTKATAAFPAGTAANKRGLPNPMSPTYAPIVATDGQIDSVPRTLEIRNPRSLEMPKKLSKSTVGSSDPFVGLSYSAP
jgi:hypothetical protein